MYMALTVTTLIFAYTVYKLCTTKSERDNDRWFTFVLCAFAALCVAVFVSIGIYTHGSLTGPLAFLYSFIASSHIPATVIGAMSAVFGFLFGETVRTILQYACLTVIGATPFVVWWMCRKKRREQS